MARTAAHQRGIEQRANQPRIRRQHKQGAYRRVSPRNARLDDGLARFCCGADATLSRHCRASCPVDIGQTSGMDRLDTRALSSWSPTARRTAAPSARRLLRAHGPSCRWSTDVRRPFSWPGIFDSVTSRDLGAQTVSVCDPRPARFTNSRLRRGAASAARLVDQRRVRRPVGRATAPVSSPSLCVRASFRSGRGQERQVAADRWRLSGRVRNPEVSSQQVTFSAVSDFYRPCDFS